MDVTLNEARTICLDRDFFAKRLGIKKWNDVYNNEEEMLNELKQVNVPESMVAPSLTFKGYVYIYDYAKKLQNGMKLTDKQITQAKKLAKEIKKAYLIREYCYW